MKRASHAANARVAVRTKAVDVARASLLALMLPPAVVLAYLVKSALGINLMAGPSPLHDLFYHLVR